MSDGQVRFEFFQKHYQDFIFDDVKTEIIQRFNTDMGYRRLNSTMYHIKKCPEKCLLYRFNECLELYGDSYCTITIHKEHDKKRVTEIEFFK